MDIATLDAERFLARYGPPDARGCRDWTGARSAGGYGQVRVKGRTLYAHRVTFALLVRPLASDEHVLHTCDRPPCGAVEHLFVGDPAANTADMVGKGRARHRPHPGMSNGQHVLTDADVLDIRRRYAAGERQVALAIEYGVSQPNISLIVRRQAWRHLDEGA